MALDTSIPLQVQMPNFAGIYQETMQARKQNELAAQQQRGQAADLQQKNALARVYTNSVNPQTGEINRNALIKGLAYEGRGDLIPTLQTEFAQQDKALAETKQKQLELSINNTRNAREEIVRATGKSDAVDIARKFVANGAIDADTAARIVQSIPDDPRGFRNWQSSFTMQLLDAEKRMDTEYKMGSLAVQQFNAETSRGQLGVAQGQLGLARQRLGFDIAKAGADAIKGKAPTATQSLTAGFAQRAAASHAIASKLENKGERDIGKIRSAVGGFVGLTPFVGENLESAVGSVARAAPTWLGGLSSAEQMNEQARLDFITAILRKESGAAIGAQEYKKEEAKYFPQIGDSDAVVKQKQRSRERAINNLIREAGSAYTPEAAEGVDTENPLLK